MNVVMSDKRDDMRAHMGAGGNKSHGFFEPQAILRTPGPLRTDVAILLGF